MDQIVLVATLGDDTLAPDHPGSVSSAVTAINAYETTAIGRGISYRNYAITINEPALPISPKK